MIKYIGDYMSLLKIIATIPSVEKITPWRLTINHKLWNATNKFNYHWRARSLPHVDKRELHLGWHNMDLRLVGKKKGGEESRWESRPRSAIREDTVPFLTNNVTILRRCILATKQSKEISFVSNPIQLEKRNTMIRLFCERTLYKHLLIIKLSLTVEYRNWNRNNF